MASSFGVRSCTFLRHGVYFHHGAINNRRLNTAATEQSVAIILPSMLHIRSRRTRWDKPDLHRAVI